MIPNQNAIDRLLAYGKGLGLTEGPLGIKSTVGARFKRVDDPETPSRPDYIAIANTDDLDLDDEIVMPSGANTSYIKANGKLFANHNYENADVVGSIRSMSAYPSTANHKAWQVRIKLTTLEAGETVRKIIEETGTIGLSVGFFAREYGPPTPEEKKAYSVGAKTPRSIVRQWDWFELSATALPCNKACQTMGIATDEKHAAEIERLVTKGLISRNGAAKLGLPVGAERKFFRVSTPHGVVLRQG